MCIILCITTKDDIQPELVIMQPLRFNTALEVEYWMLRPLIWQAEAAQPNRQLEKMFYLDLSTC